MSMHRRIVVTLAVIGVLAVGCRTGEPSGGGSGQSEEGAAGQPPGEESGGLEKAPVEERVYWNQVAGRFYPGDEKKLASAVDGHVADAGPAPAAVEARDLLGFISPHAGYPYSGPVAARSYRLLEGRAISTVILLGFSHKGVNEKSAVLPYDAYRTPLGKAVIDGDLVDLLLERGPDVLEASQKPFAGEHSLETQIPFVQRVAPDARIVPIMVGHPGGDPDRGLAGLLHEVIGDRKDVIVVASTDLSHYQPYDTAVAMDGETLDMIAGLDWDAIESDGRAKGRMCGYDTVGVLMDLASRYGEGKARGHRIEYRNSGDTAGSRDQGVVGYGSVAFTLAPGLRTSVGLEVAPAGSPDADVPVAAAVTALTDSDRTALLDIARMAAIAAVRGESFDAPVVSGPGLDQHAAAFVRIRVDGRYRGAGGTIEVRGPLHEAVAAAAQDAVTSDPRYPAPTEAEIGSLECEVIVLQEIHPLEDLETHDPETHGLLIDADGETDWVAPGEMGKTGPLDRIGALERACRRVGLGPFCWKMRKNQEIEPVFTSFTGERFSHWG